jgi:hypothetical protein
MPFQQQQPGQSCTVSLRDVSHLVSLLRVKWRFFEFLYRLGKSGTEVVRDPCGCRTGSCRERHISGCNVKPQPEHRSCKRLRNMSGVRFDAIDGRQTRFDGVFNAPHGPTPGPTLLPPPCPSAKQASPNRVEIAPGKRDGLMPRAIGLALPGSRAARSARARLPRPWRTPSCRLRQQW